MSEGEANAGGNENSREFSFPAPGLVDWQGLLYGPGKFKV
jgi:hypothetical protein